MHFIFILSFVKGNKRLWQKMPEVKKTWWSCCPLACLLGIAPVFAKAALKNIDPVAGLVLRTIFAASVVSGWVIISGNFPAISKIPVGIWWLLGIESLLATLVGDLAYYAAIKRGDVSLVTLIMSSSPLITIMF